MNPIERTHSLAQWSKKLGISRQAVYKRMFERLDPAFILRGCMEIWLAGS